MISMKPFVSLCIVICAILSIFVINHVWMNKNIELFKAVTPLISSIIIAIAGLFATTSYNNRQLELTIIQEMTKILPKLSSKDSAECLIAASSLGLYREKAIPILKILLLSNTSEIQFAAAEGIIMVDDKEANEFLTDSYKNGDLPHSTKKNILESLSKKNKQKGIELAMFSLEGHEEMSVKTIAARILGKIGHQRSIGLLKICYKQSISFIKNFSIPNNVKGFERHKLLSVLDQHISLIHELVKAIQQNEPSFDFDEIDYIIQYISQEGRLESNVEFIIFTLKQLKKKGIIELLKEIQNDPKKDTKIQKDAESALSFIEKNPKLVP